MVLPDTITVPDSLRNCLSEDTEYYRINALRVCDLLNREFIEAFVKKGNVHSYFYLVNITKYNFCDCTSYRNKESSRFFIKIKNILPH